MFTPSSTHVLCAAFALSLAFTGCKGKQTAAEAQAQKQREFQERQKVKAAESYSKIVEKYPDSPYASQAKERLNKLGPVATPKATPKKK